MSKFFQVQLSLFLAVFLIFSAAVPVFAEELPAIQSDAYAVMDVATGTILLEHNGDKQKAPASITKIMTLALCMEAINQGKMSLDEKITVSWDACHSIEPGSTHIALTEGEIISLRDAVMGTQLISANDAANVVAETVGGSIEGFVSMMNSKVEQLGLTGTHFANPNGLDQKEHYITANDMAAITRYAVSVPGFREVFGATEYQMPPTNKKVIDYVYYAQDAVMFPVNKEYYPGIEGSKLGFTNNAHHTLVAMAKQGDLELIVVALDSTGRSAKYNDMKALFDYCFSHFETLTFHGAEIRPLEIPIASKENPTAIVNCRVDSDFTLCVPLGTQKSSLEIKYDVPELYKSQRNIEPSFSIYSAGGQLLYTGQMDYSIVPVESAIAREPTLPVSRDDHLLELFLLFLKCFLVFLGVLAVGFLLYRMILFFRLRAEVRRRQQREAAKKSQFRDTAPASSGKSKKSSGKKSSADSSGKKSASSGKQPQSRSSASPQKRPASAPSGRSERSGSGVSAPYPYAAPTASAPPSYPAAPRQPYPQPLYSQPSYPQQSYAQQPYFQQPYQNGGYYTFPQTPAAPSAPQSPAYPPRNPAANRVDTQQRNRAPANGTQNYPRSGAPSPQQPKQQQQPSRNSSGRTAGSPYYTDRYPAESTRYPSQPRDNVTHLYPENLRRQAQEYRRDDRQQRPNRPKHGE